MTDKMPAYAASRKRHLDPASIGWQQTVGDYLAEREKCSSFVPKMRRSSFAVHDVPVELYEPSPNAKGCIFFVHGGHYFRPVNDFYRAAAMQIAEKSNQRVLLVDYAVYPYLYPSAKNQVRTIWDWLRAQTDRVCLLGDGTGAQMALCLAQSLRDDGAPLPLAMALISPMADLTASGDSYYDNYYLDPILGCRPLGGLDIPEAVAASPLVAHFAGLSLADPSLSPLFAKQDNLPPCYISVGEHEVLYSDAVRLADAMRKAGCSCSLSVGAGMFHSYPLHFDVSNQSKEELQHICTFLQEAVGK